MKLLAIRPRTLGDVVLTTPALRALARGLPGAAIDVVTERPYAGLLHGLPGVARVIPMGRTTRDTTRLALELSHTRYDVAVDFFGNPRSALLARASGAPVRAGYDLRGRRNAYTIRVPRSVAPASGEREYAAAVHVRLAVAVGGVPDGLDARVAVSDGSRAAATRLLARAGIADPARAVGLVPAGSWGTKTWPVSHAAALACRLEAAGREVLALTGPGEEPVIAALTALAPGVRVLPPCDVPQLAGVIERLAAVIGTDSGPRHVAAALGVPTFAWFGPTHPDTWNPPGPEHGRWWTELPCRGCDRTVCPHWNCLPSLAPDRAFELVLDHIERHARHAPDLGPAARA